MRAGLHQSGVFRIFSYIRLGELRTHFYNKRDRFHCRNDVIVFLLFHFILFFVPKSQQDMFFMMKSMDFVHIPFPLKYIEIRGYAMLIIFLTSAKLYIFFETDRFFLIFVKKGRPYWGGCWVMAEEAAQ